VKVEFNTEAKNEKQTKPPESWLKIGNRLEKWRFERRSILFMLA
jgi:hypothetical protein